jgi:hypothetical protein
MALNKWGGLNKWSESKTPINNFQIGDIAVDDVKLCVEGVLVDVVIQVNGVTVWDKDTST